MDNSDLVVTKLERTCHIVVMSVAVGEVGVGWFYSCDGFVAVAFSSDGYVFLFLKTQTYETPVKV